MSMQIISSGTERIPWEIAVKKIGELIDLMKKNDAWKEIIEILPRIMKRHEETDSHAGDISRLLETVEECKKKLDNYDATLDELRKQVGDLHNLTDNIQRSIKHIRAVVGLAVSALITGCIALVMSILR